MVCFSDNVDLKADVLSLYIIRLGGCTVCIAPIIFQRHSLIGRQGSSMVAMTNTNGATEFFTSPPVQRLQLPLIDKDFQGHGLC